MANEYLNNKSFEAIIIRFNVARQNIGDNPTEHQLAKTVLAEAFVLLAKKIVDGFNFKLIDREDAIQEGVLVCFDKLHKFDATKGKAFNYCTTVILNRFRAMYRTAQSYNNLKDKYQQHLWSKSNQALLTALNRSKKTAFKSQTGEWKLPDEVNNF